MMKVAACLLGTGSARQEVAATLLAAAWQARLAKLGKLCLAVRGMQKKNRHMTVTCTDR